MNTTKGYYCLVQYCPDVARQEAANVGVVLFCPTIAFLKAKLATANHRVRRFFGEEADQYRHLNAMRAALAERLAVEADEFRSLENLQTFVDTRANKLVLTNPKPIKVINPEQDLAALYHELVDDPRRPISERAVMPLRNRLDEVMLAPPVIPFVRRDVVVEVPALSRPVKVPYGFQNGRFNLIQPTHFTQKSADRMADAACKYAVEGRSLYEHPHPQFGQMQLIVVADFAEGDKDGPQTVEHLFREYRVRLFTQNNLDALQQEIVTQGRLQIG